MKYNYKAQNLKIYLETEEDKITFQTRPWQLGDKSANLNPNYQTKKGSTKQ